MSYEVAMKTILGWAISTWGTVLSVRALGRLRVADLGPSHLSSCLCRFSSGSSSGSVVRLWCRSPTMQLSVTPGSPLHFFPLYYRTVRSSQTPILLFLDTASANMDRMSPRVSEIVPNSNSLCCRDCVNFCFHGLF